MQIIVITGLDGAGKTTLQKALANQYRNRRVKTLHLPYSEFVAGSLGISGGNSPFGDTWTDRLIFALDNRLAGYHIKALEGVTDLLITQRGWMDSFIHGSVQGYSYDTIAKLCQIDQLPAFDCSLYLNCSPEEAYRRIKQDKDKDKYEVLEYIKKQYIETESFYKNIHHDPLLRKLFPEPSQYIDTTNLSYEDTVRRAVGFIEKHIK